MQAQETKKEYTLEIESKAMHYAKLKFCIISNSKSQASRNNLLLFTLENNFKY